MATSISQRISQDSETAAWRYLLVQNWNFKATNEVYKEHVSLQNLVRRGDGQMLFTNAESERHGGVARLHHHLRMLVLEVLGDQLKPEIKTVLHNILEKLQKNLNGRLRVQRNKVKTVKKKQLTKLSWTSFWQVMSGQ